MAGLHDLPAHEVRKLLLEQQYERRLKDQIAAGAPTEKCVNCGEETICNVVIIRGAKATDADATRGVAGFWKAGPVCDKCHRGPNTLKGHFAPKSHASLYLERAGSSNLGT